MATANCTGPCHQEGTVRIQLLDNNGTNHIFILGNCLYHPDSPVNLLSTRLLDSKELHTIASVLLARRAKNDSNSPGGRVSSDNFSRDEEAHNDLITYLQQ